MSRFVLYCGGEGAVRPEEAAQASRAAGAKVIATGTGTVVVEARPAQIKLISSRLPGWSYTAEQRAVRKPTPPRRKVA